MKKILFFMATVALLFLLVGCSDELVEQQPELKKTEQETATEITSMVAIDESDLEQTKAQEKSEKTESFASESKVMEEEPVVIPEKQANIADKNPVSDPDYTHESEPKPESNSEPTIEEVQTLEPDAEQRLVIIHELAQMLCANSTIANAATDIGEFNSGIVVMLANTDHMFDIGVSIDCTTIYCDLLRGYGMGGAPIDSLTSPASDLAVVVQWVADHL